jgi:hypothetical protein
MDTGLEKYCTIQESFDADEDNDVGHYLTNRGVKYTLSTKTQVRANYIIYTARLAGEDLTALKLIFPGIIIKDNLTIEKVSKMAKRVLGNVT